MQKVKMPKVPKKVVPTFSEKELERLLSQPDKRSDRGFRDYALLLTFIDTAARLSEIANLHLADSGDGLRLLQEDLGHASFNTTARYRKVAGDELRRWYDRLYSYPHSCQLHTANTENHISAMIVCFYLLLRLLDLA